MFNNLEVFRMASGLASHASARQGIVAQNIANADTPGYHARDTVAFRDLYESRGTDTMRATRGGHIGIGEGAGNTRLVDIAAESSINGNTVSLEGEMVRSAEIRHQHDLATSIYKSSLNIIRTSLGR